MNKKDRKPTLDRPPSCDYCGEAAVLVAGDIIYPHRPDLHAKKFWQCGPCEAWVGCHPGTEIPLGRLADAELRLWKQKAHAAFDPIWKARWKRKNSEDKNYTPAMARGGRYAALAEKLGIPKQQCHIGMMDVALCRRVVEVCSKGEIEA